MKSRWKHLYSATTVKQCRFHLKVLELNWFHEEIWTPGWFSIFLGEIVCKNVKVKTPLWSFYDMEIKLKKKGKISEFVIFS